MHNRVDSSSTPITVPIYLSTTYKLNSVKHGADLSLDAVQPGDAPAYYIRWGNPTNDFVAENIAKLENGYGSFLMASGMNAITTVLLSYLSAGDHVVAASAIYGGTFEFLSVEMKRYGVDVTIINSFDIEEYRSAIRPNTKLIYGETPCNPMLYVLDLERFGMLGREFDVVTVVDSTFASPINQKPLDYGIDISVHSGTKYLGGHTDVLCGVITTKSEEDYHFLKRKVRILGGVLSPFDAYLIDRGIKTLDIRIQVHNSNAMKIARFLESHPKIEKVWYPGLESHPHHLIAKKQMQGYGGMMSFVVKGGLSGGTNFVHGLETIQLAVSLGGTESLVEHPATMTHFSLTQEERLGAGITDGLIRLSVGIENIDTIITDISNSLDAINLPKI